MSRSRIVELMLEDMSDDDFKAFDECLNELENKPVTRADIPDSLIAAIQADGLERLWNDLAHENIGGMGVLNFIENEQEKLREKVK